MPFLFNMNLKDKINNDLKEAMRSKDKIRLETVRSIRALILEFEKSGKGQAQQAHDQNPDPAGEQDRYSYSVVLLDP